MFILNPKVHFSAIQESTMLLFKYRQLSWDMTKREISDRYAGQLLGRLWAIFHPIALMAVYVFIFVIVFKVRIGGTHELPLDYTAYLLCGLIPWFSFQDSMNKSTTILISNANLVKQVVFPIEILPVKGVMASFFSQIISTTFLVSYVIWTHGALPWTYMFFPLLFFLQVIAMIGVSYILSAIGVYFRDLKEIVQVFSFIGIFLIPILYLPTMVPTIFRPILYLNPFSYMIWCYQDIFYFGRFQHPWAWVVFTTFSFATYHLGYLIFKKLKIMFGNVL